MKGKTHLLLTLAFMAFFVFWLYKIILGTEYSVITIAIAFACVIVGSILPDADMTDGKSKVLHGIFLPIGLLIRLFEYPLAFFLDKRAKHRGVLHNPIGILFSSLIIIIILSVILYFIGIFSFMAIIYFYLLIAASQLLHVLEDAFSDYIIYFIIILAIIVFFVIKFGKIF